MSGIADHADAWLQTRSRATLVGICLLLVGVIGLLDYLTGREFGSAIFYLVPVFIAAWYAGSKLGLTISSVSMMVWLTADLAAGDTHAQWVAPIWEASVWFGIFIFVAHLGATLALALERERRQARADPLTGLMNRRAFNEEANRLLELALSHGHCTTVIYVDVDNFKEVNDQCGHSVGDRLLTNIAEALGRAVRSSDLVGRHGGDEFVLLLPETDYEGAQACVTTIQHHLLRSCVGDGCPVTFSVGVATFLLPPVAVDEAIKVVDRLMYKAKNDGKDGVIHEIVHVTHEITVKPDYTNEARTTGRRMGEKSHREDL